MINACCNLYFCFIITVHGDIRHLEMKTLLSGWECLVDGDIRHLEKLNRDYVISLSVHGDIRHLEKAKEIEHR